MPSSSWTIRAVQLDLARQMETLESICGFIDFAADFGYNVLHLYLEDRVRTASYPYRDEASSYSLEEMSEVVTYAAERGIEVVPQVNCMSHMEHFFKHEEMHNIAELREGGVGRFGGAIKYVVCPSIEQTFAFFERYLGEVASVFPSGHFGVGLDEVWDMGICSACQARLAAGESLDDLFAVHVRRLHAIVTGKLGKRMWMWDDMFEEYPQALAQIPTDILQLTWQYDTIVGPCKSHFGRRRSDDRFAEYNERGIEFLIGPGPWAASNTSSFTRYALPFKPLGGMMTVWELSTSFLLVNYPTVAFAGRLWCAPDSLDAEALFKETAAELFGISDPLFLHAVYTQQSRRPVAGGGGIVGNLRGQLTAVEREGDALNRLLTPLLSGYDTRVKGELAKAVLDDILLALHCEAAGLQQRSLVEKVYAYRAGLQAPSLAELAESAEALVEDVSDIVDHRATQWESWRAGLAHENGAPIGQGWKEQVTELHASLLAEPEPVTLLTVTYAMPDLFGTLKVVWEAQFVADGEWETVYMGAPKPRQQIVDEIPFYVVRHPMDGARVPVALRVRVTGYGGAGVAWLEVDHGNTRVVPVALGEATGKVSCAEALLVIDTTWCKLGEGDAHAALHAPALAAEEATLEIRLGPPKVFSER